MRMHEIRQQIGRGEYEVDHQAVADAILRRLLAGHGRPDRAHAADPDA